MIPQFFLFQLLLCSIIAFGPALSLAADSCRQVLNYEHDIQNPKKNQGVPPPTILDLNAYLALMRVDVIPETKAVTPDKKPIAKSPIPGPTTTQDVTVESPTRQLFRGPASSSTIALQDQTSLQLLSESGIQLQSLASLFRNSRENAIEVRGLTQDLLRSSEAQKVYEGLKRYFESAGVLYSLKSVRRTYSEPSSSLSGKEFFYDVFVIKGVTKTFDAFTLALQNIFQTPVSIPFEIQLDPFMTEIFMQGSNGKWLNPALLISHKSLVSHLNGSSFSLIHEFEHVQEESKVYAGDLSFASVTSRGYPSMFTYASYFRWDEITTHIRDLRRYWSMREDGRDLRKTDYERKVISLQENLSMALIGIKILERIAAGQLVPARVEEGQLGSKIFSFNLDQRSDNFSSLTITSVDNLASLPGFISWAHQQIRKTIDELKLKEPQLTKWFEL